MVAISEGTPVIRQVRLLNKGSSSWVNVNTLGVVSLNEYQDGYEELRFVSEKVGKAYGVKIYGVKSNRWLCYNKRWRLVGKLNGTEGRLGDRCVFAEDLKENSYYIYRPLADMKRLLGFRKKTGAPTKGWAKNNLPTEDHLFNKIDEDYNQALDLHNEIKSNRERRPPPSPPPPPGRRHRPKHRHRHNHGVKRRKPVDNNTAPA